jgi:Ca-activated chloride channel homolog
MYRKIRTGIKELSMNRAIFMFFIVYGLLNLNPLHAQQDRKYARQGNRQYNTGKYTDSETLYRKAMENRKESFEWAFNTADALYKQGKYEDAARQFEGLTERKISDKQMAGVYHNLGNSLLQAQKLPESIEAYKNALRRNPDDLETKYNLAYAMNLLQQQQNKQQNQGSKDKNKNKEENNQDKDQKKDQDKNQQKQDNMEQQKTGMSREDAKRLLDALQNDEKKVLEKLNKQQAKSKKLSTKDW